MKNNSLNQEVLGLLYTVQSRTEEAKKMINDATLWAEYPVNENDADSMTIDEWVDEPLAKLIDYFENNDILRVSTNEVV